MTLSTEEQKQLDRIEGKIDKIKPHGSMFPTSKPDTHVNKVETYVEVVAKNTEIIDQQVEEQGGIWCPVTEKHVLPRASNVHEYGNSCFHNIGKRCNAGKTIATLAVEDCPVRKAAEGGAAQ